LCLTGPIASHDFERFTLRRQTGSATDGSYRKRRQRDADEQAIRMKLEHRDAASGVGDIGDILTGGDEDCRQAIRVVRVVADRTSVQVADDRRLPYFEQLFGR